MSRLTQIIKFVVVILIILINPFERKISLRFLSKIGVSCILGLFIFRGVEFVSTFGMQSQLNNFIPFLLEQNAGLTQELIANFYYAPAGFELNPLFFLRHFPIPFESSILGQLNALHNGGVEEWIYGIKKSSMGGLPFLPLAQNYFIGGIPLTILSAAISGIVLGKMNGYMNNWAKVKKNKKQIDLDMTLGFYALIWYIYPGFSFPGPIPILGFASSLFILGKLKKVES